MIWKLKCPFCGSTVVIESSKKLTYKCGCNQARWVLRDDWKFHLGEIVSSLYKIREGAFGMHEDVDAFYAPRECHQLVEAGVEKERKVCLNELRRKWGIGFKEIEEEVGNRIAPKYAHEILSFIY